MTSIQRFVQTTQAFDPDTTSTLGQAFDMACALLGILEAAKAGERDPVPARRRTGRTGARAKRRLLTLACQRVTNSHVQYCY
jgi:hypothetical protein